MAVAEAKAVTGTFQGQLTTTQQDVRSLQHKVPGVVP